MKVTEDKWEKIEDRFRVWAFGIYYHRTYANELDPVVRFVKALVKSANPIQDRKPVLDWYRRQRQGRRTHDRAE